MSKHEDLLHRFYTCLQNKDYNNIAACYHDEAHFKDEAFDLKSGAEVRAMWKMLFLSGKDLSVTFTGIKANETIGSGHWEARYTFSKTGRKVLNKIDSFFEFKDGLIYRQIDRFNFWTWSRQALGMAGTVLGWSGFLQNKVRRTAMGGLISFMKKDNN